jgi:hypothetical protein
MLFLCAVLSAVFALCAVLCAVFELTFVPEGQK